MNLLEQDKVVEQLNNPLPGPTGIFDPSRIFEIFDLIVNQYELVLTFIEDAFLPYYPGSMLRGSFGHAFRKVACPFPHIDAKCPLGERCLYLRIFETPPPPGSEIMTKYTQAPHPFVIEPDWNGKRIYKEGETFCFGLILIGQAIQYLPYFVYAFLEHGKVGMGTPRAKYSLSKVFNVLNDGKKLEIFDSAGGVLKNDLDDPKAASHKMGTSSQLESITINFMTPTRLKYNEHLAPKPEFHIVIRNLLRRLSLLSYFHGGFKLELPFKEIIDEAALVKTKDMQVEWVDWERYSSRQKTHMTLGGFIGNATYEGNLSRFLPYLTAGESIHVGKGATFGLGKYELYGNK